MRYTIWCTDLFIFLIEHRNDEYKNRSNAALEHSCDHKIKSHRFGVYDDHYLENYKVLDLEMSEHILNLWTYTAKKSAPYLMNTVNNGVKLARRLIFQSEPLNMAVFSRNVRKSFQIVMIKKKAKNNKT